MFLSVYLRFLWCNIRRSEFAFTIKKLGSKKRKRTMKIRLVSIKAEILRVLIL